MRIERMLKSSVVVCLTILLSAPTTAYGQSWLQLGNELTADETVFAVDVAASGGTIALGSPLNGNNVGNQGTVKIYNWTGNSWLQKGNTFTGDNANDNLGFSVALSSDGNRVVIGSPNNDDFDSDAGRTDVYSWNNGAWQQLGASIFGLGNSGQSGRAVSINDSGDIVAVGAFNGMGNGMVQAGNVRIFQWDGTDWAQLGSIIAGEAQGDRSGYSIALNADGTKIVIGAITNSGGGSSAGQARVFSYDGTDWVQQGGDIDGAAGERFGRKVSISGNGNRIVCGASFNFDDNSGLARAYEWSGSAWVQMGSDFVGENPDEELGSGVAINGDGSILVIGIPGYEGGLPNVGQAKIYVWQNNSWVASPTTVTGTFNGTRLGRDVAINNSGDFIGITLSDRVRVLKREGSTSVDAIKAGKGFAVTLLPNPASQQFTIDTDEEVIEFSVLDLNGRLLMRSFDRNPTDVTGLPAGFYLVSIKTTSGTVVRRLMKTD